MLYLLDYIYQSFYFNNSREFIEQLRENNYQDYKSILLLLLPYLDKFPGREIKSLNEIIYFTKEIKLNNFENKNLMDLKRELKYSNFLINLLNQYENDFTFDFMEIMIHAFDLTLLTIRQISNKLLPNWVNVIPHQSEKINNLITLVDNQLKRDTNAIYQNLILNINAPNFEEILKKELYNPRGIWIGEYYNVIINFYYLSVISSKFLIYNFKNDNSFSVKDKEVIYGLDFLYQNFKPVFPFKEPYENLPENISFEKLLLDYFEILKSKPREKDYFKVILYNFLKRGKFTWQDLESELFILRRDLGNNIDFFDNFINDDNEFSEPNINEIKENIYNLFEEELKGNNKESLIKDFYNFLYDKMIKFKFTPYYHYFFNNEKFNSNLNYLYGNTTCKHLYNISKLISIDFKNNKFLKAKNVITNPIELLKDMFEKIIDTKFYAFDRNLLRFDPTINLTQIKIDIRNEFLINFPNLVQDVLLRYGILNQFIVNPTVTNSKLLPLDEKEKAKVRSGNLKKFLKPKENEINKSYYYLTNNTFENLNKILIFRDKSYQQLKYLDYLTEKTTDWIYAYGVNWISQIDFATQFLHQQVMYITGATGQGKSTLAPVLTLYACKAFSYKNDASVVCTQPRLTPTMNNIDQISNTMGVPILVEDKILNTQGMRIPSNNFYYQFKHSQDQHMNTELGLKLTMTTDGTLINQVKTNPYLKKFVELTNKEKTFSYENLYDVVMVDESHEHNHNMDLIISFMRNCLYLNKDVKLFIVSATMDLDEPSYRSYFSIINDNLTLPYRNFSIFPIYKNNFFANANLLDRRYHISPPGGTTRFTVLDEYRPVPLTNENDHKLSSQQVQEASYKLVEEIVRKNPSGEILLFLTGEGEIKEAVKQLNKILPPKVVALPLYTSLHTNYQEIVTKIDEKIRLVRNRKDKIDEEWGVNYIEGDLPLGTYERAVILATNVAEASVTIPRLKYVIDNGYAKENSFDSLLNKSILSVQPISDASRTQRRGRVGRKSSGVVYYLYEKGAREKIKPKYKMTQLNPTEIINGLIQNSNINLNDKKIFRGDFDFNLKIISMPRQSFKNFVILFLTNQLYLIKDYHLTKKLTFQEDIINIFYQIKSDGLDVGFLNDFDGRFYIVHPDENKIIRNYQYKIIFYQDKFIIDGLIPKEVTEIKNNLLEENFYYLYDEDKQFEPSLLLQMSSQLNEALNKMKMTYQDGISILFGNSFGVLPEVILSLILVSNPLKNLYTYSNKELMRYLEKHSQSSDLLFYLEIARNICIILKNSLIIQHLNFLSNPDLLSEKIINLIKSKIDDKKDLFLNNLSKLNLEEFKILQKMKARGIFNSKKGYLFYAKSKNLLQNIYQSNINLKKLEEYFENNFIDKNLIPDLISNFINISVSLMTLKGFEEDTLENSNRLSALEWSKNLENFLRVLKDKDNQKERILFSLISGRIENIFFNLPTNSKYYTYNSSYFFKEIIPVNKATFFTGEEITSVPNQLVQHYFSLKIKENENQLSIISNLPEEWLIALNPVKFSKKNLTYMWMKQEKIVNITNHSYQNFVIKIREKHPIVVKLWNNLNLWIEPPKKARFSKKELEENEEKIDFVLGKIKKIENLNS
jgi:hypothetical protein